MWIRGAASKGDNVRSVHKEIQKIAFVTGETSMKHKEHATKNKNPKDQVGHEYRIVNGASLSRHQGSGADASWLNDVHNADPKLLAMSEMIKCCNL